jgi:hypothetical protein
MKSVKTIFPYHRVTVHIEEKSMMMMIHEGFGGDEN